jgi:hypothetical protein
VLLTGTNGGHTVPAASIWLLVATGPVYLKKWKSCLICEHPLSCPYPPSIPPSACLPACLRNLLVVPATNFWGITCVHRPGHAAQHKGHTLAVRQVPECNASSDNPNPPLATKHHPPPLPPVHVNCATGSRSPAIQLNGEVSAQLADLARGWCPSSAAAGHHRPSAAPSCCCCCLHLPASAASRKPAPPRLQAAAAAP